MNTKGPATVLGALLIAVPMAQSAMPSTVTLNNGVEMPLLAYGANIYPAETCQQATSWAIQAGFRFIWSSEIIGEACQRAQRAAIDASGVPRGSLFLAGTVNSQSCAGLQDCYEQTKAGSEKQFAVLSAGRLDMLMLDYPSSSGCDGIKGQWKAFEELYAAQRVRTIAVSNFGSEDLQCVAAPGATVPSVNQLRYNVGVGQSRAFAENRRRGIVVQAYSPLGSGDVLGDPRLAQLGQAHGKSAAQVALRWLLHQGVAVNLASTSQQHLAQDAAVFDFDLSEAEMAQLSAPAQPAAGAVSAVEIPAATQGKAGARLTLLRPAAGPARRAQQAACAAVGLLALGTAAAAALSVLRRRQVTASAGIAEHFAAGAGPIEPCE